MKRLCLVPLIGLPAAGKTTVCQNLMQMESSPFNILHLCYDDLIHYNSELPSQYKERRESILKSLEAIIQQFKNTKILSTDLHSIKMHYKNYQRSDNIILCDDNHYYRSMRYKLFQLARQHSIVYCQIYFKCPLKLALERNSLRNESTKVPTNIIVQMYSRLEIPNTTDNKWEENTLFLKNSNFYENKCNEIVSFIAQCLDKPLLPIQISVDSKSKATQSKVHELDLLLRKRIKELITSEQQQNQKLLAKNLNIKRKDLLKTFQIDMHKKLQAGSDLNKYVNMLT